MQTETHAVFEEFRILLLDKVGSCAYLSGDTLPTVLVHRHSRLAYEITKEIRRRWGLCSVVLRTIPASSCDAHCIVLEIVGNSDAAQSSQLRPIPAARLSEVLEPSEFAAYERLVADSASPTFSFARLGWLSEVREWLRLVKGAVDDSLTDVEHFNAGLRFALLKLTTSDGAVCWLKAVGFPNTREYEITKFLRENYAEYLPPIRDMRDEWHAWLMENVGDSLYSQPYPIHLNDAAQRLAMLQIASAGTSEQLLKNGFLDHRPQTLETQIDAVVDYLQAIMPLQRSTKSSPLTNERLSALGVALHDACREVSNLGIPDCILHGDFSFGSILSDGRRLVFTDWCEAYVGTPFITLEQFCVRLERDPRLSAAVLSVRSHYYQVWARRVASCKLQRAQHHAPLLAAFSCLYGDGTWLATDRKDDPTFHVHARSLARYMDRVSVGARARLDNERQ